MLHVHRRQHVDAGVEQHRDVFPALGSRGARDVRVRKLVDDGNLRMPREDGVGVHLLEQPPAVIDRLARNGLEPLGQRDRVGPRRAARSSRRRRRCRAGGGPAPASASGTSCRRPRRSRERCSADRARSRSRRQCGKTRTSMPSARRIRRSSRLPRDAGPPRAPEVVADEELRDRCAGGRTRGSRRSDRWPSRIDDLGLLRARQHDVARERRPVLRREVRLVHVDGEELAVEAIGVAPAAGEHRGRIGPRRHADEDTLLRAPRRVDAIDAKVVVELPLDDVGREQQRPLAQGRQRQGLRVRAGDLAERRRISGASTTTISSARSMKACGTVSALRRPKSCSMNGCCSSMSSRLIDVSTEMPASRAPRRPDSASGARRRAGCRRRDRRRGRRPDAWRARRPRRPPRRPVACMGMASSCWTTACSSALSSGAARRRRRRPRRARAGGVPRRRAGTTCRRRARSPRNTSAPAAASAASAWRSSASGSGRQVGMVGLTDYRLQTTDYGTAGLKPPPLLPTVYY